MDKIIELNDKQLKALQRIILDWVADGFIPPPFPSEYYDVLEKVDIEKDDLRGYFVSEKDIRRPKEVK